LDSLSCKKNVKELMSGNTPVSVHQGKDLDKCGGMGESVSGFLCGWPSVIGIYLPLLPADFLNKVWKLVALTKQVRQMNAQKLIHIILKQSKIY